jgi:hypothetical protein
MTLADHVDVITFPLKKLGMIPFKSSDFYHFRDATMAKNGEKWILVSSLEIIMKAIYLFLNVLQCTYAALTWHMPGQVLIA